MVGKSLSPTTLGLERSVGKQQLVVSHRNGGMLRRRVGVALGARHYEKFVFWNARKRRKYTVRFPEQLW